MYQLLRALKGMKDIFLTQLTPMRSEWIKEQKRWS